MTPRRPRALVVDDGPASRESLVAILEQAGFDVYARADARAGLEAAHEHRPDVILLDLRMPGARDTGTVRGGEEMLRKLKADPELWTIPVFIVSGEPDGRSADSLRRAGASGYFSKPFDAEQLLAAIWGVM